jgi:hypothetical protein
MFRKNRIIVHVVWFFIVGFFLITPIKLSTSAFAGFVCCQLPSHENHEVCASSTGNCEEILGGTVCGNIPDLLCTFDEQPCSCTPQIPTLNRWGKIITIAVIGSFAVIGLIIMRRRSQ